MVKFAVFTLLSGMLMLLACQKEISCEQCANNKPPVANAGPDQTLALPADSTRLDGSASADPDGNITVYKWTQIAGPNSSTIVSTSQAKTTVKALIVGIYQFELMVTDDGGLSAKDTLRVQVNAAGNQPPVACAGPDQTITLPTNTAILNGGCSTDPDNNITTYNWRRIGGPASGNLTVTNAVQTQVTNLVEGIYPLELTVTDAGGSSSRDTVQLIVVKSPNSINCGGSRTSMTVSIAPVVTLPEAGASIVAAVGNKLIFSTHSYLTIAPPYYTPAHVYVYDVVTQTSTIYP
jgi:hypothetical protein